MNVDNMSEASDLIVQILVVDVDTGETQKVAKGILNLSDAQIFTKLNDKYNKFMQKIKITLDLEDDDDISEFILTIKWSPEKKLPIENSNTLQFKT